MLKCVAIDDEELALDLLEDNISRLPFLQLTARFHDAVQAAEYVREQKPDLVFPDIHMPGLSGIALIRQLTYKPMFILVTAYEEYAVESYDLNVVDYLMKPVPFERFAQACNKALDLFLLKKNVNAHQPEEWCYVKTGYQMVKVQYNDIVWIEGLRDYVKIHLKSDVHPIVTRANIKSLETQLPSSMFVRIHRSYIVSKKHISAVTRSGVFIGSLELTFGENYRHVAAELTGFAIG